MPAVPSFPATLLILLLRAPVPSQQAPANLSAGAASQKTLFVNCQEKEKTKGVFSPVWLSEDGRWRSFVEVDVQSDGCLHTTRLWIGRATAPYRLVYLIPPNRTAVGNGMEILGWARNSSMLLVMTEEWQMGSDAPDIQRVLAIDAQTGMVYEPELETMLEERKDKQCSFRVMDAGLSAGRNVEILVRARFSSVIQEGEFEANVPPAKGCGTAEQTWSFDFATGEVKQLVNTQPLELFKRSLRNPRDN
jgi:hypothetical protein